MKGYFCILFCLSLFSCQSENDDKPADMIPQTKMVQILADVHTAEAQIEGQEIYPDTALMSFNYVQEQLLKQHGVTQQQFRDTYHYYQLHVKEMDKLYEIIIDTLSVRESKAKAAAGIKDSSAEETAPQNPTQVP